MSGDGVGPESPGSNDDTAPTSSERTGTQCQAARPPHSSPNIVTARFQKVREVPTQGQTGPCSTLRALVIRLPEAALAVWGCGWSLDICPSESRRGENPLCLAGD